MQGNFILYAITTIIMSAITSGKDGLSCLEFSYCNLIKGDIARESDKYSKDPTKFYKDAEEGVKLYKSYIKTLNDSSEQECTLILATCKAEVAKMAVEDLKLPSKYQDSCDYMSYSRTIFKCKNIHNWPQTIKEVLPKPHRSCRVTCIIQAKNKVILSTGIDVNTKGTGAPPPKSGDVEVDALHVEQKSLDSKRKYVILISAFDNGSATRGWGELDLCPENSWVTGFDRIERGGYLFYIAGRCSGITTGTSQTVDIIESTVVGNKPEENGAWGHDYRKRWGPTCSQLPNISRKAGRKPESFVVGIALTTKQFKTYGMIPLYVNFICANSDGWVYLRERNAVHLSDPSHDSKEMVCPNGTAVCALQTKSATFDNVSFLIDVRIGCCIGYGDPDFFTYQTPLPTTMPVPVVVEDLSDLQKRSDYYLFWDESEVLNDIITRYNIYYSPAQIDNEGGDLESTCKTPGYISSYELRDPKSCYFQGRRVAEIKFNCTFNGQHGDVLDIYGRLKTGHTLQDSKYFDANSCDGGFYTGMEFTYYVDKEYPYLVNAWAMKLKCSVGTNSTDHQSVMKAYGRLDLATLNPVKANVNCDAGRAICGFRNKIEHKHLGTFEAFYFKVICCRIVT